MSGPSKADREIIAQGKGAEKASEMKTLFGTERMDQLRDLPITFGNDSSPSKSRGRSPCMKPLGHFGSEKMPVRQLTYGESVDSKCEDK